MGKYTLASILLGEEIPQSLKSTDGLIIYFGRNGIDLKDTTMVPLRENNTAENYSSVLLNSTSFVFEINQFIIKAFRFLSWVHDCSKSLLLCKLFVSKNDFFIACFI